EAALARHPSVRQAAVIAHEDSRGEKRLAAYVVPAASDGLAAVEIRRWLRDRLPEAMVPSWLPSGAPVPPPPPPARAPPPPALAQRQGRPLGAPAPVRGN